jgi:hypothetical protein
MSKFPKMFRRLDTGAKAVDFANAVDYLAWKR